MAPLPPSRVITSTFTDSFVLDEAHALSVWKRTEDSRERERNQRFIDVPPSPPPFPRWIERNRTTGEGVINRSREKYLTEVRGVVLGANAFRTRWSTQRGIIIRHMDYSGLSADSIIVAGRPVGRSVARSAVFGILVRSAFDAGFDSSRGARVRVNSETHFTPVAAAAARENHRPRGIEIVA